MSIKKYNTYFKEEDGKIYYYDENGEKKNVPSQAFGDLQEQIDNLSPLTYSGSKSVEEINALTIIKRGDVYTITGDMGVVSAGNITVVSGDEIAWADEWFIIGKDTDTKELSAGENIKIEEIAGTSTELPKTVISVTDKKNLYVDPATMWMVNNNDGVIVGVKDCPDDGNTYVRKRGQWIYNENDGNAWKKWSEEHGSSGVENNFYIGTNNIGEEQGINIGIENEILSSDSISGASINLGNRNKSSLKSINIGFENETYGKSIGLGWDNKTDENENSNSILLGRYNYSESNENSLLKSKELNKWELRTYTEEQIETIRNRYNAAVESMSTYTAQYYNLLTSYGADTYYTQYYLNYNPQPWEIEEQYAYPGYIEHHERGWGEEYYAKNIDSNFGNYWYYVSGAWLAASAAGTIDFAYRWQDIPSNVRTEYTAARQEYEEMVNTNNTFQHTSYEATPETNNIVIGTTNSAAHYNSIIIGSNNQTLSAINDVENDDGFTMAIGLGNMAGRNYDIAIGHKSLASGGQNFALNASAYGTNNIALTDSYITKPKHYEPYRNTIAFNKSVLYGEGTDNIIGNTRLDGEYHQSIIFGGSNCSSLDSYGNPNSANNIGNASFSFIYGTPFNNLKSNGSFIFNDGPGDDEDLIRLNNVTANYSLIGFDISAGGTEMRRSLVGFGTSAYGSEIEYSFLNHCYTEGFVSRCIGVDAYINNSMSVIAVTDGLDIDSKKNYIQGYMNSLSLGDNYLVGGSYSNPSKGNIVAGEENKVTSKLFESLIIGGRNEVYASGKNSFVIGSENILNSLGNYNEFRGTHNVFQAGGNEAFGNTIVGEENIIGKYFDSIYSDYYLTANYIPGQIYSIPMGEQYTARTLDVLYSNTPYVYAGNSYKQVSIYNNSRWSCYYYYVSADKQFSNYARNDYNLTAYTSGVGYYNSFYLNDFVTPEQYNALPETAKSTYTGTSSVYGVLLRYKQTYYNYYTTYCFKVEQTYIKPEGSYFGKAVQHITQVNPTVITASQDSMNSSGDNIPEETWFKTNERITAYYGLTASFGNSSCPVTVSASTAEGFENRWVNYYPSIQLNRSIIYGTHNSADATVETNLFINGLNNLVSGSRIGFVNVFGDRNKIYEHPGHHCNDLINHTTVIGARNHVDTPNGSGTNSTWHDWYGSTMGFAFGQNNYIINPQSIAMGSDNSANGPVSFALGNFNKSYENQFIIGKYNEEVDKVQRFRYEITASGYDYNTQSYTAAYRENDVTTGVLFAIGNGYFDEIDPETSAQPPKYYDEELGYEVTDWNSDEFTHRSNAMIVSANGTVSAGDFAISGGYKLSDISAVLELLNHKPATGQPYVMGLDNNGNLTWMSI